MATDDAMSVGERLDQLLSLWQAHAARGREVPAAELCPDSPELAAELEKRTRVIRAVAALARPGPGRPAVATGAGLDEAAAGDADATVTRVGPDPGPVVHDFDVIEALTG